MNKIYSRIESIVGNVIAVEAQDIAYGELAQVILDMVLLSQRRSV